MLDYILMGVVGAAGFWLGVRADARRFSRSMQALRDEIAKREVQAAWDNERINDAHYKRLLEGPQGGYDA